MMKFPQLTKLEGIIQTGNRIDGDRLHFEAISEVEAPVSCNECGSKPLYKHGKRKHSFADIPFQNKHVKIETNRQRYRYHSCGSTIVPRIPPLDEKRRLTKRLLKFIQEKCTDNSYNSISKEIGLAVNTVKAINIDI